MVIIYQVRICAAWGEQREPQYGHKNHKQTENGHFLPLWSAYLGKKLPCKALHIVIIYQVRICVGWGEQREPQHGHKNHKQT